MSSTYSPSQNENNENSDSDLQITSSQNLTYENSTFNQPDFQLGSDKTSNIYIFKNGLFTRSLLNIDITKERQILVKCTTCNFQKTACLRRFQASNFAKHYLNKHPTIAYNKESEKTRKKKTETSVANLIDFFDPRRSESRKRNRTNSEMDFQEDEAYKKILNFIIDNNLSFNILNSESFKDLLNYYNKSTPIINRHKIKTILENTYVDSKMEFENELEKNLENNGLFSLTFDIWTSLTQTSYMGVIVTYIDSNFILNYKLIGFDELNESHTGLYIHEKFTNILNQYEHLNINNILSITRDNASNNTTFMNTFKKNYNFITNKDFMNDIRCVTHIINLVVQDILQDYILNSKNNNNLIEYTTQFENESDLPTYNINITAKVRKIVTSLKYVQENRKLLLEGIEKGKRDKNITFNYNVTHIPLDNATRWNSTYNMINTFLMLKSAILYVQKFTSNKEFKKNTPNENEWEILTELKNIFEIFVSPTIKLQGQRYTTLNTSLLYIYKIYNKLDSFIESYTTLKNQIPEKEEYYDILITAIKKGIEKFQKYFPKPFIPSKLKYYKAYFLTIVLDPRQKLSHFKENGLLYFYPTISNDITAMLRNEYSKLKKDIKNKKNNMDNIDLEFSNEEENTNIEKIYDSDDDLYLQPDIIEEEYDTYLKESLVSRNIQPLEYWRNNNYNFPILSTLARRYLAIPATSASIESTFSIGNNIITKSRNRLNTDTVKQLILLKSWKINNIEELDIQTNENE